MFKLIKWTLILGIVLSVWVSYRLVKSFNDQEIQAVKEEAVYAIETGEVSKFTVPLTKRLKAKLLDKQNGFFNKLSERAQEFVGRLFE